MKGFYGQILNDQTAILGKGIKEVTKDPFRGAHLSFAKGSV